MNVYDSYSAGSIDNQYLSIFHKVIKSLYKKIYPSLMYRSDESSTGTGTLRVGQGPEHDNFEIGRAHV